MAVQPFTYHITRRQKQTTPPAIIEALAKGNRRGCKRLLSFAFMLCCESSDIASASCLYHHTLSDIKSSSIQLRALIGIVVIVFRHIAPDRARLALIHRAERAGIKLVAEGIGVWVRIEKHVGLCHAVLALAV